MTLRHHLWRAARVKLLLAAVVSVWALGTLAGVALHGGPSLSMSADPDEVAQQPGISALVTEHACWAGRPPADMVGRIPGHVVVTLPSGRVRYAGTRLTGAALRQVFDGRDAGLVVHAFCR